jgi:hypothetical protein
MNHALLPAVGSARLPEKYEAARTALANCDRVDECKNWADKSQELASYARQSQNKDLENMAMRIRARAIRRCGELLKQVEKANGGQPYQKAATKGSVPPSRKQAAKEAGLSEDQAKDAIRVANVAQDSFDTQVESDRPPTVTALAAQGKTSPKGVPVYEKLGMTKKAFQAGMYFRGEMDSYVKAMGAHDPQDVAEGSLPEEREAIRRNLKLIEKYHTKLESKL